MALLNYTAEVARRVQEVDRVTRKSKGGRAMLCSLSTKLDDAEMREITTLEEELGHPLLAFSCHPVAPATISAEQLAKIQQLEARLDVSLVAVEG